MPEQPTDHDEDEAYLPLDTLRAIDAMEWLRRNQAGLAAAIDDLCVSMAVDAGWKNRL